MEKTKKPTNAQLTKRIKNAVLLIDKTKDTKTIFFSDTATRITITPDYAIVEKNGNQIHIFAKVLSYGYSRPYLYLDTVVDFALAEEKADTITTPNGLSWYKLLEVLKGRDDQIPYGTCHYVDMWMFNVCAPVYSISEDKASVHLVLENYWHNVARTNVFLQEKTEPMTNKQFGNEVLEQVKSFIDGCEEEVIFEKKTDEELQQEEMKAMAEFEDEQTLQSEIEDGKQKEK